MTAGSPSTPPGPTDGATRPPGGWPVVLCWLAVAVDGFDLVVLGVVIPTLLASGDLGSTPATVTTASTLGLVGVGIGAVLVGPLTDRFGRRLALITSIVWFSLLTLAIPLAPDATTFTVLRFAAGLGLGACLPTALTFMTEHAGEGRRSRAVTLTMTGYHVGAVVTALLGLALIGRLGWESMFVVGGLLGLALVPLMWWKLPESDAYLAARAAAQRRAPASRPVDVVRPGYLATSLGLWAASFCGLLLVYGLNTWLPQLMGEAGYSIQAGIGLILTLNVGAVLGLLVAGRLADARGTRRVAVVWFAVAAVLLALLSVRIESALVVYAAVLLTGVFVFSAQVLVYAHVGQLYPATMRGTALGMAAGVGRIGAIVGPAITGGLVAAGIAYPWGFYVFAAAAAVGVLAMVVVPARRPV